MSAGPLCECVVKFSESKFLKFISLGGGTLDSQGTTPLSVWTAVNYKLELCCVFIGNWFQKEEEQVERNIQ